MYGCMYYDHHLTYICMPLCTMIITWPIMYDHHWTYIYICMCVYGSSCYDHPVGVCMEIWYFNYVRPCDFARSMWCVFIKIFKLYLHPTICNIVLPTLLLLDKAWFMKHPRNGFANIPTVGKGPNCRRRSKLSAKGSLSVKVQLSA